jgi:hypothetical protein
VQIPDQTTSKLQSIEQYNSKMLGRPIIRSSNATESDHERLEKARYTNSSLTYAKPFEKPEHLAWNLRPRQSQS